MISGAALRTGFVQPDAVARNSEIPRTQPWWPARLRPQRGHALRKVRAAIDHPCHEGDEGVGHGAQAGVTRAIETEFEITIERTRSPYRASTARVSSREPSSTTITSRGGMVLPERWSRREWNQIGSVMVGMTTLMSMVEVRGFCPG